MIRSGFIAFAFLAGCSFYACAQSPVGIWVNYHPEKGSPLSHIEFYEKKGKLNARVLKLIDQDIETICSKCKGNRKDENLTGMTVIWNLTKKNSTQFKNGRILDPGNGRIYKCFVQLCENDKLKVHGYLGIKAIGKSQYWSRLEGKKDYLVEVDLHKVVGQIE